MSQTFLDENPPMILDATCSYGRIWPAHATVRIDIRPETKPDFVMDNTNLNFPDAFFDEIYYDPPHVFRRGSLMAWASWLANEQRWSPYCFYPSLSGLQ